jgi:DNA mismatch repair ATPase MutS
MKKKKPKSKKSQVVIMTLADRGLAAAGLIRKSLVELMTPGVLTEEGHGHAKAALHRCDVAIKFYAKGGMSIAAQKKLVDISEGTFWVDQWLLLDQETRVLRLLCHIMSASYFINELVRTHHLRGPWEPLERALADMLRWYVDDDHAEAEEIMGKYCDRMLPFFEQ